MSTSVCASMVTSMRTSSSSYQLAARRNFTTCCSMNPRNRARMPVLPMNPGDPFLSKPASVASNSPERLRIRALNSETLYNPDLPASLESIMSRHPGRRGRRRTSPSDLASRYFDRRIVVIGLPLVPIIAELVIAQMMYLQDDYPHEPIHLYINSSGTSRDDDGEILTTDTEALAVYDFMSILRTEVHTLGCGLAVNIACLLLAAGTKGQRRMLPGATAKLMELDSECFGIMSTSDVASHTRELKVITDRFVKLIALYTGNTEERVASQMRRGLIMEPEDALEFGVIDEIWKGVDENSNKKKRSVGKLG